MKTKQNKAEKISKPPNHDQPSSFNDNKSPSRKGNDPNLTIEGEAPFKRLNNKNRWNNISNQQNFNSRNAKRRQRLKPRQEKFDLQLRNTDTEANDTNPQAKCKNKKFHDGVKSGKLNSVDSNADSKNRDNFETKETVGTSQEEAKVNLKKNGTALKKSKRKGEGNVEVSQKKDEQILNFEDPKVKKKLFYRTLLVGNLAPTVNKAQLLKLFSKYGKISHVVLKNLQPNNLKTALLQSFIVFQKRQEALQALEVNGMKYKGHNLQIQVCDNSKYDQNKAIVITNLSIDTENNDLWATFKSCGPVLNVHLVRNKKKIVTGTGYVNFESASSVQLALKMKNIVIKNKTVKIGQQKNLQKKKQQKGPKRKHLKGRHSNI